jgi:hypothetical protein
LAQQKTPSAGQRVPPATAPASKEQRGDAPFVALPLIAQSPHDLTVTHGG